MKTIMNNTVCWRIVLLVLIFLQASCNKDFPNILQEGYKNKEIGSSLNKVLLIVVDGVRGNAMTDIDPQNMRLIARNAFYSNSALADYNLNQPFSGANGLANIFTGVNTNKHLVRNDLTVLDTKQYPTLFDRLKSDYNGFHAKGYTTNADVETHLFTNMEEKACVATDDEVISKTKEAIKNGDTEMIVAHLSDIEKVGKRFSFESSDANYRDAILKFDAQIMSLISTLEERPNYKTENWLVVISSSVGGDITTRDPDDQTVYADHERNVFTYFYSPRFTRKYQARPSTSTLPFVGAGLHLSYGSSTQNATSAQLNAVDKMNFTSDQSFTITFFFKQNTVDTDHNYPPILIKRNNTDDGTGWQFIMSGGSMEFSASGISKIGSAPVKDAKWHAITVSVDRTLNTAKIYTDGELSRQTTAGTSNLTNTIPMVWGKKRENTSNNGDFIVCNLQVYNVAMTDEQVKSYAGLGLVKPENSPFYTNLLGYWPAYSDNGTRLITDVTGKAGNLVVLNELKWASFDEFVPFFKPDINEGTFRLVPNLVDIALFVYQWYGVLPKESWRLDGLAWTPPYAVLEY